MSPAHGVLAPGFSGTTLPGWVADALASGLAGVVLFAENTPDVATTRALTDAVRAVRPAAIVASDEEGGDVTRLEAAAGSSIPGNAALGAADDPDLTRAVATAYGRLIALAGIDLALAPCLDVASEPLNPVIGVRSFGADPDLVTRHGRAWVAGLAEAGVASCAKHFPGHGATRVDSHVALPVLDADAATLRDRDQAPFAAVPADAMMTAHVVVPARSPEPASLAAWAYDDLRASGFTGPVLTDALGMRAIADRHGMGEACVRALEAGADLLLLDAPHLRDAEADFREAVAAIEAALTQGRLSAERLRASAARTATLARPGRPEATPAAVASAEGALAEVGRVAASRAVRSIGFVGLGGPLVLIDLRRRLNHASGRTSGALLAALTAREPRTRAVAVEDLASLDPSCCVVVLTREPLADPDEAAALASVLAVRPDAVVVHGGLAAAAPRVATMVLAHGVGRANAEAAADLMLGGAR